MAALIVAEGSLSFLGMGIPPPQPSWGGMISDGKHAIGDVPHMVFVPSTVIFLTVFALNQVGDHLRLGSTAPCATRDFPSRAGPLPRITDERSTMTRKRRFLAAATAGCVVLLLAACGSGAGSSGSASGATGAPVAGGTGRVLSLWEPVSLDPALLGNAATVTAVLGNALYGTLMISDETAGEVQYKMAESFTSTDNGATFELKLRPNLKFSDGTPLDAAAVKFNWDRTRDPATGSATQEEAAMVAATTVVDPVTLQVTMAAPVPNYAQAVLTTSLNWIAQPAALQAGRQAFDQKPIGAGPFTLERWARQDAVHLVKNPGYWDAPRPYLDRLTIKAAPDVTQRLNAVTSGDADVAVESSSMNFAKAQESGLPMEIGKLGGGNFLALNTRRAPFDDVRARQAVAAALDVNALNESVYSGTAELAETLFDRSSPFYSDTPLITPDRAKAQQLFDALAAEGKPVSFTYTSYPITENRRSAEAVQAQLSTFGNVTVKVNTVDFSQVAAMRNSHDFDMISSSATFLDPEPTLYSVLHGSSRRNMPGIDDAQLNAALADGRNSTSPDQRKAAYQVVQDRLSALVPGIFPFRSPQGAIGGKNVGGLTQYGLSSLLPENIWIEK